MLADVIYSFSPILDLVQNTTIEERVALLEIQVVEIEQDVTDLDQDVNFLFDEQIIQDERLFSLEQETDAIDTRLLIIDNDLDTMGNELEGSFTLLTRILHLYDSISIIKSRYSLLFFILDIQNSIISLNFRVTVLEENGGGDGNSSVAELEVRVETLEGTAADHETRISAAEADIDGDSF